MEEVFLSSQEIYRGCIINVERWRVRLPNGQEADREIVLHRGAAAIVPLDDDGCVTLVRQHRIAAGRFTWEIPAGKLDGAGENMLLAAHRELEEETGLRAAQMRLLTVLDTTPGFCSERIGIYLATGLSRHESHPDADEFLNVTRIPLSDAVEKVMAGEIRDGKTVAGLLMTAALTHAGIPAGLQEPSSIQRPPHAFSSRPKE